MNKEDLQAWLHIVTVHINTEEVRRVYQKPFVDVHVNVSAASVCMNVV